jgi:hypothetical protein
VYARHERGLRLRQTILLGHAFAIYSLQWMVVGYWAVGRILRGRRAWHKTERLIERPSTLAAETKAVAHHAP